MHIPYFWESDNLMSMSSSHKSHYFQATALAMNLQVEALPIASSPFNSIGKLSYLHLLTCLVEHNWAAFRRFYNKRLVMLCTQKKCPKERVLLAIIESAMEDIG